MQALHTAILVAITVVIMCTITVEPISPSVIDYAMILSSALVLLLLFNKTPQSQQREHFFDASLSDEDDIWVQHISGGTLIHHISVFRKDSWSDQQSSSTWTNVANPVQNAPACQGNGPVNRDFNFNSNPVWANGTGFALANTVLTGPNAMDVFPQTRAYTLFCLFQLSGLPKDGSPSTLLHIPANGSPSQNGLNVTLQAIGSSTRSSIKSVMQVTIGNQLSLNCSDNGEPDVDGVESVTFDSNARYLMTITRSSVSVRVSLFHVESSSSQCTPNIVLSAQITDDALVYNNQPIVINGGAGKSGAGILGNIMSFGIFDNALSSQDEAVICNHYHDTLLLQDPMMKSAITTAAAASAALACPYDTDTCGACSEVTNWTNTYNVASGGPDCLNAINTYCNTNPTSPGCECYDPSNYAATRRTCQVIKSMYSGDDNAMCASQVQKALSSAESTRDAIDTANRQGEQSIPHACDNEQHSYGDYNNVLNCYVCQICGRCGDRQLKERPTFFAWLFALFGR